MKTGTTIQSLTPHAFVVGLLMLLILIVCLPVTGYAEGDANFGVSALLGTSAPGIAAKVDQAANSLPMTRATAVLNAEVDRVFDPRRQPAAALPPAPPQAQQVLSLTGGGSPTGAAISVSFPREPLPQREKPDELKSALQRVHEILQWPVSPKQGATSANNNLVQELQQVESHQNIAPHVDQNIEMVTSSRLDARMPAEALGPGMAGSGDWDTARRQSAGSDLAVYSKQASASARLLDAVLTLPSRESDGEDKSSHWKPPSRVQNQSSAEKELVGRWSNPHARGSTRENRNRAILLKPKEAMASIKVSAPSHERLLRVASKVSDPLEDVPSHSKSGSRGKSVRIITVGSDSGSD